MPITHDLKIEPVSERQFRLLDYEIMELVFAIHNDLGRFADEIIYKRELAYRCEERGFDAISRETPIYVTHREFSKTYYMDLLVDNCLMYELKTVEMLSGQHRKQALNYLLLAGMNHGKLVNMRPQSVQYEFVSTTLRPADRYEFTIDDSGWREIDEDSRSFHGLITDLLSDWGLFLSVDLFYDAVVFFGGGEDAVVNRVEVFDNARKLGSQRCHMLNSSTAFRISSVTEDDSHYERHLQRYLQHTHLEVLQWVNFNRHNVVFKTVLP